MIYSVLVMLPMYRQLYASNSLSLDEWERRFIERSSRAKKEEYKIHFRRCHSLILLAKVCGARHVNVKSQANTIKFIFDFSNEECMNCFLTKLAREKDFRI